MVKKKDPNRATKACPKKPNAHVPYQFYWHGKGMQKAFYWFILLLCGVLWWLISIFLPFCPPLFGILISGLILGAILTFGFGMDKRQSAKAGLVSGVICGIVLIIGWISFHIMHASGPVDPFSVLSHLLVNPYVIFLFIFDLIVSSMIYLTLTTLTTSILRRIFKIQP